MGFSVHFFVTSPVIPEKASQTHGKRHQWLRRHKPTGITHIPTCNSGFDNCLQMNIFTSVQK